MKYFIHIIIILFWVNNASSEELPYYLSADVGYGLSNYDANFFSFEGIESCNCYKGGDGNNINARLMFEYKVVDFLNIGAHFGYIGRNAELEVADTAFARNLETDKVEFVQTGNRLDMNFSILDVGLDFNIKLSDNLINGPLYLNIAPSYFIQTNGNYIQTEYIKEPSGAAFLEDDRIFFERENANGSFTTLTNTVFNTSVSLFNHLKISKNLYFTQRVGLSQDFSDLLTDADITSTTYFAALGIKLTFEEKEEVIPPPPPLPPTQPLPLDPSQPPVISLNSNFDYKNSYIETGDKLVATEPIVLAVFFDKNNAELRERYIGNSSSDSHYELFSKIMEIMNENPKAKLTLRGSTSRDEEKRLILSKNRVENVKNQLLELGLDEGRIITKADLNAVRPTNPEYEEGREENRRVRIELINANSVKFVEVQEYETLYGKMDFQIETENINDKVEFGFSLDETSKLVDSGLITEDIKLELDKNQKELEVKSYIKYETFSDENIETIDLRKLEEREVELRTDEFEALLMFDFASSDLTNESKTLLKQLADILPENKTISIIGNTDYIGLEEANIKLANERANNAIEFIKNNTSKNFNYEYTTNQDKRDESTPQGRFLNRSIIIRIK